jgi:hypothetical protein
MIKPNNINMSKPPTPSAILRQKTELGQRQTSTAFCCPSQIPELARCRTDADNAVHFGTTLIFRGKARTRASSPRAPPRAARVEAAAAARPGQGQVLTLNSLILLACGPGFAHDQRGRPFAGRPSRRGHRWVGGKLVASSAGDGRRRAIAKPAKAPLSGGLALPRPLSYILRPGDARRTEFSPAASRRSGERRIFR